jgi:PAS domain S-box-containing protein
MEITWRPLMGNQNLACGATLPEGAASWLHSIFENAPDGYFIYDLEGVLLGGNRAIEDLSGYSRDELRGKKLTETNLLLPEQLPAVHACLHRALGGEPTGPDEYTIVRKDGSPLPAEIRTFPTVIEGRQVVIGCLRDITDRKRAERARQERLQRTQRLQAAILEMTAHETVATGDLGLAARCLTQHAAEALDLEEVSLWLETPSGRELRCVAAFELGQGRHVEGMHLRPVDSPDAFAAMRSGRITISRAPESVHADHESSQRRLDAPVWISSKVVGLARFRRVRGSQPHVWESEEIAFAGETADLFAKAVLNAERRHAVEALRRSEASLERAQRMASLGNWQVDLQTDALECSSELRRIFGIDPSKTTLNRTDLLDRVHPEDRAKVEENVREALRAGKGADVVVRVLRPDGSQLVVREHAEVEFDASGAPRWAIGAVQDITEHRRLEERVMAAQKMETVGRLAGGVAHDFNNLLTVINGYSAMLLKKSGEADPGRRALLEIHKAGEKAAELTRQLLAFSRQQVVQPQVLDLNETVRESESMLRRVIGETIELRTVLTAEPATVNADAGQLHQIVMNLVLNARDAMLNGGRILIETATTGAPLGIQSAGAMPDGRYVQLSVSDNGAGMDEETRSRIFEPFFTTKLHGGTGLGLATIYGIVKQSNGWIWVYSEPQRGATIKVYLPHVSEAPQRKEIVTDAADTGGDETILLVEDQEQVRDVTAALLEERGYAVLSASSAAEALSIYREHNRAIDLVITDVVMPGGSGADLAAAIAEVDCRVRILFMSGYSENAGLGRGDLSPGEAFIEKPFSPEALAAKVRSCLGSAGRAKTVLVIDDEAPVREMLREFLADGGYRVLEASNGDQGIHLARTGLVDLVITDLVMPEKEGIETIMQLRRELPWLNIVALSGAGGGKYLGMAKILGARSALAKPVSPQDLLAAVREALEAPGPDQNPSAESHS